MSDEKLLTINEVELETGISAHTIRYYDKCGFFDSIARTSQGRRRFSNSDIDRLLLVDAFRKSGLSIDGLKNLVSKLDDAQRQDDVIQLCKMQMQSLEAQIDDYENCIERIKLYSQMLESKSDSIGTSV